MLEAPIMVSSGSSDLPLQLNPWEAQALNYGFPQEPSTNGHAGSNSNNNNNTPAWIQLPDPIIYPGIYSASGIDVMGILLRIASRPNPTIDLGPLDCSVSLTLCDISLPDAPIVYASPGFYQLTGYSAPEIMGRNCRFLQNSPHMPPPGRVSDAVQEMRRAIRAHQEVQVRIVNYKKNGTPFTNVVTILPLWADPSGHHFAVGLQAEL
ncbi:glycoside hydrolase family 15, cellulose signaling associated protein envoy [Trichoderma reesei QM6a]|uniref:Glycoside hydrolase family 15, cellulose signaling associated protein envoy n=3 Tax=Hypocrea jecorina TaxID=51453 RepID=G0RUC2_HYPJQ|nr:glycoside hydrolase family 15, cellulose signaling associated protein envoy [Trichoderma reesei QM6a]AAT40588.1 cellulose signalling associated protein ENVOY [Trichoderma reesei]EGR45219.1 glycoside hydrolase family 15, cellulose signaling associated protein envoy [Trichoderma reesei QM6a]ETR98369.1 cellulose signaling associated protein envoy [Trichoderma reesei RUT C-30]